MAPSVPVLMGKKKGKGSMKPAASIAAAGGSGSAGGPDGDGDAPDLQTVQEKGQKVVEWFLAEAGKLRGAAPSPDMLDNVQVEAYGELVPLPQVAQVALRQGSKLVVAPFDPSLVGTIERAIRDADLGLNPSVDGSNVAVPVPKTTKESRAETAKALGKLEEASKVRLRKARHTALDKIKRWGKGEGVSEDEAHALAERAEAVFKSLTESIHDAAAKRKQDILGNP